MTVQGDVARGFEPVRDAFAANFERAGDYAEVGAALCVYRRGEMVVDLWGGHADAARSKPWAVGGSRWRTSGSTDSAGA